MSMLPVVPEIRGVVSSILEQASGDLMRLAGRLMFVLSGRNSEFMLRPSAASISTAREGGEWVAWLVTVPWKSRTQLAV